MKPPYTIRRTSYKGRPAELLTFTGATQEEYDAFLGDRFADGREPIGFRTGRGAPTVPVGVSQTMIWAQFRRLIVDA